MSRERIEYWAQNGIEFGSHSRTHADLVELPHAECSYELLASAKELSGLAGMPIVALSYPYGNHNESVRNTAKTQFSLAFGSDEGMNFLCTDPFTLRRIHIKSRDTLPEFALGVFLGKIQPLRKLRGKLRIRSRFRNAIRSVGLRKGE